MNVKCFFWGSVLALLGATSSLAEEDMKGASDHPEFPRISGSIIATYAYDSSAEALYLTETNDDLTEHYVEGEVTKLLYLLRPDESSTLAVADYIEFFEEFDAFEAYYGCSGRTCESQLSTRLFWPVEDRFPKPVKTQGAPILTLPDFMLRYPQWHINKVYISGEVTNDTGSYTVSLYAAESTRTAGVFTDGQAFIDLQIVKNRVP